MLLFAKTGLTGCFEVPDKNKSNDRYHFKK